MLYLEELVWLPNKALNNAYARLEKPETFEGKITRFCFIQNANLIFRTTTSILYHFHISNFFPFPLVVITFIKIDAIRLQSSHLFTTKSTHPLALALIPFTLPPSFQRTIAPPVLRTNPLAAAAGT